MNNSSAHTSSVGPEQALRFSVHSIGWVPLTEADLQGQEISCRSINRCILDLTQGKTNDGMAQFAEVNIVSFLFFYEVRNGEKNSYETLYYFNLCSGVKSSLGSLDKRNMNLMWEFQFSRQSNLLSTKD